MEAVASHGSNARVCGGVGVLIASIEPFLPFEDLPEPRDNARFRASVPPEDMATVLETFPTSIQRCLCQSLTT